MGPGLRRIYFSLPAGGCSTGRRPISIVIMDFEEEAAAVRFERAMHGPGRPAGIGAGGEALATLAGGIVADSQIAFGDTKSGATVAVVGTITNASRVSWRDIQFHVDFLNAAGKRADVGEREDYNFRLPPRETSSFKVSFRREFPETNHVTPVVRVVGAKDLRARW